LLLLDQNLHLIKQYTEADGLPSMRVYDIEPDYYGGCWFFTEGGLGYLSASGRITQFGNKFGLYNQFQVHRLITDTVSKKLKLHETGYLHRFSMSPLNGDSLQRFPVYITGIHTGKGTIINQPHNHFSFRNNDFTIDFVALDYINTEKIQYAYLLEGSNDGWVETGNQHSIRIANLREGTYTFRVKARIENGPWMEARDVFNFTIRPPFYRAWWFYLLSILLATGFIYLLYRQKINRIRNEEKIRNKIARDLHDDIGSTLSGINLFSKLAMHKMEDNSQEAKEIVQKIGDRTENMMGAMSDIVWSINPGNDSVADMLVRMKEYAAEMLEAKEIQYRFEADESVSNKKLDLSIRKEIFMIYKEAVNNVVKHAGCTIVAIQLSVRQNRLLMQVTDNGKGLQAGNGKQGNGLKNMQERALLINATLDIQSGKGDGTTIQLVVPIT
jgi:two-component sensor histidine kinase